MGSLTSLATFIPVNLTSGRAFFASVIRSKARRIHCLLELEKYAMLEWLFLYGSLSFGSLRLASTDVRVNSVVRFNCFTDPKDVETRLSGSATSSLEKYHLIKGKSP